MAQITFIPIIPKRAVDWVKLSRNMKDALRTETVEFEQLFRRVSDGFSEVDVEYTRTVETGKANWSGATETNNKIMSYLNYGTDERWALMSDSWESKTKPGQLSAGAGYGRVVLRGKQAMMAHGLWARPGIDAREWDKEVKKLREKPFKEKAQQAITKALK